MRSLFILILLAGVAVAQESSVPVHYWNGDQRVEVWLALDEVAVRAADRPADQVEALPAAGLAGLERRLKQGPAHAVLYRHVDRAPARRESLTARLSVRVHPGADIAALAARHGLVVVEAVAYSPDTWILAARDPLAALAAANALYEGGDAVFATPLIARRLQARATTNDPLRSSQWHLPMIGAATAWDSVQGVGVNIAIVDDGVEYTHPDLNGNARTSLDIDLNGGDNDASHGEAVDPDMPVGHGTIVAGIAAADGNDNTGTVGVAYAAGLVGVRLISLPATDAQEAQAMNHRAATVVDADRVHVSNNSWGPADDGATLDAPGPLMRAALANATTVGRGGRGTVFCWSAGNGGGEEGDNSAYDGYSGNRYTIGVAACGPDGVQAPYSESGCNVMITAPGGTDSATGGKGIVAPDRLGEAGFVAESYLTATDDMSGTSFAAPMVAGVAALLLQADPSLTWRDVMHVLIRTAAKNDASDSGWFTNGAGLPYNPRYGFGLVQADDAVAAVASKAWRKVPASAVALTASEAVSVAIPDGNPTGITRSLAISAPATFRAEHVEFTVNVRHGYRGNLAFELIAPSNRRSIVPARVNDDGADFSNWTFTSVVHWGEVVNGSWQLKIVDPESLYAGTLTGWSLRIHGYLVPASPTITAITPEPILTGSPDTILAITGSGFDRESEVRWAGAALATTFVSATRLDAMVPAARLASSGLRAVTVENPAFQGMGGGTSAASTVRVSARPTIAGLAASGTTAEDSASGSFAFTIADDDVAVDSLTISAISSVGALVPATGIALGGTGASRTLKLTPNPDANSDLLGTTRITVTVSDGVFTSLPATLVLTVTAANDLPIAYAASLGISPGQTLSATLVGSDPDGTAVTFNQPTTPPANGTATISAAGLLVYSPTPGFAGLDRLTYTVSSGGATSVPASVLIAVDDPMLPRARIVSEVVDETTPAGDVWDYTVVVDRREITVLDNLRFTLIGAPAGMSFAGGLSTVTVAQPGTSAEITWAATGANVHVPFTVLVECVPAGGRGIDLQPILLKVVTVSAPE